MVVLMEEFGGLSLKRKVADEPGLFAVGGDDRSVFPLSCRATKMRRVACPDGRQDAAAVSFGGVGAVQEHQVDLPMGDAMPSSPAASAAVEEEKAMVLYDGAQSASRLRPCGLHLSDWVRAMLREADSRTVRELLAAGAQEHGDSLALAVVPWVPLSPAEEAEPSSEAVDAGDSDDGAAAMDVEEDEDRFGHWTRQTAFGSAGAGGCGEGYVYRWPQLPVVGQQASPVMWSW